MFEWIEEVDKLVQSLGKEMNDRSTRVEVAKNIVDILNKHKVKARIDCSESVNTPEVVFNGSFRAQVETPGVLVLFKFMKSS